MPTSAAGRQRPPRFGNAIAPARFDGYPYLVSRIGRCAMRHIAVLPADWPRERLLALARAQAAANRLETAVCFGSDDAVYVATDGIKTWAGPTPSGLYVVERLRLAEALPDTDELRARRARLAAFEQAHNVGGYIVGDGAEDRRAARPAERLRLGAKGPHGLPAGLTRCPVCGWAAGECLVHGTDVVRCRCACENDTRCARCGACRWPTRRSPPGATTRSEAGPGTSPPTRLSPTAAPTSPRRRRAHEPRRPPLRHLHRPLGAERRPLAQGRLKRRRP